MYVIASVGDKRVFAVPLGDDPITVGRGRDCDLVLPLQEVSRLHAVLRRRGHLAVLEDRSRNGIVIDGHRVPEATLKPGDSFRILSYTIQIVEVAPGRDLSRDLETLSLVDDVRPPAGGLCGMVGTSALMLELYQKIRQVARSAVGVLVTGETGTGKELVARALHTLGPNASGPWIPVNCAAISPDLVESELFGFERGAFTGASARSSGAFEAADGGTIFLDEIGEMPLAVQPKLLRVLEDHRFSRIGAHEPIRVDIRVIAATNRNLADAVARGQFRSDLYHRLCVVPLLVPPLRDRGDDVVELARLFLAEADPPPVLTPDAVESLRRHPWPGNVRELRNVIRRLIAAHDGTPVDPPRLRAAIEADLRTTLGAGDPPFGTDAGAAAMAVRVAEPDGEKDGVPATLQDAERLTIARALEASGGNRLATAKRLGIAPSTLYAKMRRHGIR